MFFGLNCFTNVSFELFSTYFDIKCLLDFIFIPSQLNQYVFQIRLQLIVDLSPALFKCNVIFLSMLFFKSITLAPVFCTFKWQRKYIIIILYKVGLLLWSQFFAKKYQRKCVYLCIKNTMCQTYRVSYEDIPISYKKKQPDFSLYT